MTASSTSPLLPPPSEPPSSKTYGSTVVAGEEEADDARPRGERVDADEEEALVKTDEPKKESKPFREMALLCFGLWTR